MNLITAVWPQRVLAMPMSLVLIGRVERGDSAYWPARGGAFDSLARTSSTRQSLVRETTSFMYRQRSTETANRVPTLLFAVRFFSFFSFLCRPSFCEHGDRLVSLVLFFTPPYIGFVNRRTRVKFATPLFFSGSQVNDVNSTNLPTAAGCRYVLLL